MHYEKAYRPEDLTRFFVERSNAGDADGVAALYDENAVMAYPPGQTTVGRAAIRDLWLRSSRTGHDSNLKSHFRHWSATILRSRARLPATVQGREPGGAATTGRQLLRLLDQPEFRN